MTAATRLPVRPAGTALGGLVATGLRPAFCAAFIAVFLAAPPAVAHADEAVDETPAPVIVTGRVEPDTVTIGTHFRYTLEVDAPAGLEIVLSQPSEKIGDFDILDFGDSPTVEHDDHLVVTRWYTLVGWEPGYFFLTSPPVLYRAGDGEHDVAPEDETVITVESLLKGAAEAEVADVPAIHDIRDIKDVEPVPIDWRPYWLAGGVLLAFVVLGAGLFWLLNRRHHPSVVAPATPPHEIAYAELARLRRLDLIQQGAFKEYYSGLSGIIRRYVELRFGVRAPEMTTEEFLLHSARDGGLRGQQRGLLGGFLSESDLVKFARHMPTIDDSERAYDAAKRFVDETAPARETGSDAPR